VVITLLGPLASAVTADGRYAVLAGGVALEAILELTVVRASGGGRTAIVALLETGDDAIAALGGYAGHARKRAGPSLFALAGRATSITGCVVFVVASLRWVDSRIPAHDLHAQRADRGAPISGLDHHAIGRAPIVVRVVSVVAGLDGIAHAITAVERNDAASAAIASDSGFSAGTAVASSASAAVASHSTGPAGTAHAGLARFTGASGNN